MQDAKVVMGYLRDEVSTQEVYRSRSGDLTKITEQYVRSDVSERGNLHKELRGPGQQQIKQQNILYCSTKI